MRLPLNIAMLTFRWLTWMLLVCVPGMALDNSITVHNPTAGTLTNWPIITARMFAKGEQTNTCVAPYVSGTVATVWQCEVVNRWTDNSLKFVKVAFQVPSVTAGSSVVVDFRGNASTTSGGAALTKSAVLAASWEADMRFTYNTGAGDQITVTRDLRTIFNELTENETCAIGSETATRKLRRYFDGPVATVWIVEDLCTTLAYDFGYQWNSGTSKWVVPGATPEAWRSIHPYFMVTAYKDYPSGGNITVKVTHVVESPWTRKWQDQVYRQRFRVGPGLGTTLNEETVDYRHIPGSVYRWDGFATSTSVDDPVIDWNLPYLVYSKAIPAFVTEPVTPGITEASMPTEALTSVSNQSATCLGTTNGAPEKPQYCRATNGCGRQGAPACQFWTKAGGVGGSGHELGLISGYYLRYLYGVRNSAITLANKKTYWDTVVLGLAHSGANMPGYMRESRSAAAYCAALCDTSSYLTRNEFGRGLSISAHSNEYNSVWSPSFLSTPAGGTIGTNGGWNVDYAHLMVVHYVPYLLTGDYVWGDLLQRWAHWGPANGQSGSTTMYSRNLSMGYMGWGGSIASRWQAWRLRNIFMAMALLPAGPEYEYLNKVARNTGAAEEGYLGLTAADGALYHDTTAGSPWRYGQDTIRTRDGGGTVLSNTTNALRIWEHRISPPNIVHQADNYIGTLVNSAHAPWMTGYTMASMAFGRDHEIPHFNAVMEHVPTLTLEVMNVNRFMARDFNYPTHKQTGSPVTISNATSIGGGTIEFVTASSHGLSVGNQIFICCSSSAWANGWAQVDTNDKSTTTGSGTQFATVATVTNATTFRVTIANWSDVSGTYPACCAVSGKYSLSVKLKPSTFATDGGPPQSTSELRALLHPRMENYTDWSTAQPYRLYNREGSYTDTMIALFAACVDFDMACRSQAQGHIDWIKANNSQTWFAFSTSSSNGCNGTLTPTYNYCGNANWMIWPRHRITQVSTVPSTTTATIRFTRPTGDQARVAVVAAAAGFPDTRESGSDVAATCFGRVCSIIVSGLTTATNYRYRITAGPMGGTVRSEGTFSTN